MLAVDVWQPEDVGCASAGLRVNPGLYSYRDGVTVDLSGRLIFLASPGGLTDERTTVEETINEFNQTHALEQQVIFVLKRWEALPGGLGRPQGRINPHLDRSDFVILLMGERWGSPPDQSGKWGAGTEEEFHRCLDRLADADAHMRDILVIFKTLDPDRLRDPGPQLQHVMNFRNKLDVSKVLMYDTFDSPSKLSTAVQRKLAEWVAPLPERTPRRIEIESSDAPVISPASGNAAEALAIAKLHAEQGLPMQAEAAFAVAIESEDPHALSAFAQFMRRTGRFDAALGLNRRLLANKELLAATDPTSIALRVTALANIGTIERLSGDLAQSRVVLKEAVRTARMSRLPIGSDLCYALDNYGLTLLRMDEPVLAREQFQESLAARQDSGAEAAVVAQSRVNLARADLSSGDTSAAEAAFTTAIEEIPAGANDLLLANALAGAAEARLRQRSVDGVLAMLEQARTINDDLGHSDGSSIVYGLMARYHLLIADEAASSLDAAERFVGLCEREGVRTGNQSGLGTAALLHAEVAFAREQWDVARERLADAYRYTQTSNNRLLRGDVAALATRLTQTTQEAGQD